MSSAPSVKKKLFVGHRFAIPRRGLFQAANMLAAQMELLPPQIANIVAAQEDGRLREMQTSRRLGLNAIVNGRIF